MRMLLVAAALLSMSQFATAQLSSTPQVNSKKLHQLLKEREEKKAKAFQVTIADPVQASDTARYSHTTKNGNIYSLPQDKMPCLRPDSTLAYRMPVAGNDNGRRLVIYNSKKLPPQPKAARLPNAYTGKSLVWEQPKIN